jgi:hypothetical protein
MHITDEVAPEFVHNESLANSLKTMGSVRNMPAYEKLIAFGFLVRVDDLTDEQRRALRAQLAALQQYTGPITPADEARYHAEEGDGFGSTVRKTWNKAKRIIE